MSESGGLRWPGSGAENSADEAWLTAIAQAAAGDSQAPLELLVEYLTLLADAAISGRRPRDHEMAIVRELGRRAAEQGIPAGRVVDLYLSAAWRMWRRLGSAPCAALCIWRRASRWSASSGSSASARSASV